MRIGRGLGAGAVAFLIASGVSYGAAQVVLAAGSPPSPPAPPPSYQITTTASAVPPVGATLFPTGSGALYLTVSNSTGVTVQITALSANGNVTPSACGVSINTTAVNTWLASAPKVPDRQSVTFAISNGLSMAGNSSNACQGSLITVPVKMTASQAH